jgi:hypothetical protein
VAPGTPAGSYALSDLETVDLYSGRVNFVIPIHSIRGRGSAGYQMAVPVQRGWTIQQVTVGTTTEPYPASMETPDVSYGLLPSEPDLAVEPYTPGYMVARAVGETNTTCAPATPLLIGSGHTLTKVVFIEPDGTETEFVDQQYGGAPQAAPGCSAQPQGQGASRGTVFVAIDGSAKTFIAAAPVYDETWVQPKQYLIDGRCSFPTAPATT